MVEMFATWCPPCRRALPHVAQMREKYPNVFIVSVSNEDADPVEKLMEKFAPMKLLNIALDVNGEVAKLSEVNKANGIPHAFVIKDDIIVWQGHPMDPECEAALSKLNEK